MNSYDAWKEGRFDSESPINKIEVDAEIVKDYDTLSQAYYSGHEYEFKYIQREILYELDIIYQVLKASDHGMKNRVLNLIDKVK